jgi:hypothetical protein
LEDREEIDGRFTPMYLRAFVAFKYARALACAAFRVVATLLIWAVISNVPLQKEEKVQRVQRVQSVQRVPELTESAEKQRAARRH